MRTPMIPLTVMLTLVLSVNAEDTTETSARQLRLSHCLVSLIEEAKVPAREKGVLEPIQVREGMEITKGVLMATIYHRQADLQKELAQNELKLAQAKAKDEIELLSAKTLAQAAQDEYQATLKVFKTGASTESELRQARLAHQQAKLQIQQAEHNREVARLSVLTSEVRVKAAELLIEHSQIKSPISGVVTNIYSNGGEWVNMGDPIARVVRMDRLRVEGFVNVGKYAPREILGKEVTVEVRLAHDRTERLKSKIVFVSPLVEASGDYRVWTEITNRRIDGHWVLQPGLTAEMTIQLAKE